jgi:hypothetical protein
MVLENSLEMRRSAPRNGGATQRVLLTRVKRESLGKYEAEPRRFTRLFTLHDASLEGHVGAERLKVN